MAAKRKKKFSLLHIILLVIGLVFLGFSAISLWDWYSSTNGTALPPNGEKTITFSTSRPNEKAVPHDAPYNVPPDQPKKIVIPSISAEGFIQPVGKDQYNNVGVPTNIHFAGWFVESVRPGDTGLSIIDGHVSSRYGSALFAKLGKLGTNDTFQVQFGDDTMRRFQVVERRELNVSIAAGFLFAKRKDIEQQLNLITCGGTFNKRSDKYNGRTIIVSKRIDG